VLRIVEVGEQARARQRDLDDPLRPSARVGELLGTEEAAAPEPAAVLPTTSVRAPITVQTYAKRTLMPLSGRSPRKPPVALEATSLHSAWLS
jgi:uncharacterized protein YbjT (DUF2867 family)